MSKTEKRQTPDEKKAALLAELVEVRGRILGEAAGIAPQDQDDVFLGVWCLKDLLAHLAGWDVTNRQAAQEILRGEIPGFYAHYDKDWASYNAQLVAEYRREDLGELIDLLKKTHGELLADLEAIPAPEFYKDRGIRASGYKVLLNRLLEAELKDEREHLAQIQAFAESKRSITNGA